ncbi:gamma-aminobutyric acid type B receptor subunit 2-like [Gigantopelta aegis]|uniref:gamma-aminobutyric acid type B receptor subunit 2-like n=1 Tax=Gigantopelta aegis TaxID=1735272 RepID=UPI001B88BC54|nr:gamma-aminobutyric acid type B receptor subunit 2-like [Gigantopelta aegis]
MSGVVGNYNATIKLANSVVTVVNDSQEEQSIPPEKPSWEKCDAGSSLDVLYHHLYTSPVKLMVIGGACSPVSEATAQVSFRWNLVQISHLSSSPSLSNKDRFKRFFRIISPATHVNPPRIHMMKYFGWKKISTVHQAIELFSEPVYDMFKLMKKEGIDIVRSEIITTSDVSQQVRNLKENGARIVLGDFYEDIARKVFCEAYKIDFYGPRIVWILNGWYSQTWWNTSDSTITCTAQQILSVINGYIAVDRLWVNSKPEVTVSGYTPQEIQTVYLNHSAANMVSAGLQQGLMAYDALWAAALAINRTITDLQDLGGTKTIANFTYDDELMGQLLLNNTKKTDFYGTSGHLRFDEQGDPTSRFKIDVFRDGDRKVVGLFDPDLQTDIQIEWEVQDVAAVFWKDGRIPTDSIRLILRTDTLSVILYILVCGTAGIGALLTCCFLVFSFVFRGKRVVKMSSPLLNVMTLIGCLLLYGSVFLENTRTLTNVFTCQAKAVSLTVGFSLTFGALFAKTWRVYRIFTTGAKQKTNIQDFKLIVSVCSLAAVNLMAITVWFVIDPMEIVSYDLEPEIYFEADIEIRRKVQKCESPNQIYYLSTLFAIQGILLLLGTFLALQTRNVKVDGLNDSKMIGVCIYNVIVLSTLGVIMTLTLKYQVNLNYGITSSVIIIGTTITQCLIVVPKMMAYWNSRNAVGDQMTEARSTMSATVSRISTIHEMQPQT